MREKVVGALLGLACGDALGAPVEFLSQDEARRRWGTVTEMVGGGQWEPGEWTDDTAMALCVAEGILEDPLDPVEPIGRRFLEWRRTAKDVGATVAAALDRFRGDWAEAGRSTPQAAGGKAAGNGSLMRTLPVALAYPDVVMMLRASARISAMTHWDPQAEACCALYCLWVRRLLEGEERREAWRAALAEARDETARPAVPVRGTPGTSGIPPGFWDRMDAVESLSYEQLQPSGYAGYVVECLEAAVWCCLQAESLEQAIVLTVNLAGEADTMAAVAGGAAGAFWGQDALPERWLSRLRERERLTRTAELLADLRHHQEMVVGRVPPLECCQVAERVWAGRNPLTAWDIECLRQRGVTHILDLRREQEWSAPGMLGREALEACRARGIERVSLPFVDAPFRPEDAPAEEQLTAACECLEEWLKDPASTVYVHCRAGIERTASVLTAWYARRHGLSYEEALEALRKGRPALRPTPLQAEAVRRWLRRQKTL